MAAVKMQKMPPSPHGTLAWLSVVRAYNLCEAVMTERLAALGVRVGEHEVLATLATSPGLTQQALAARCFVTKSGVSMLLTQMEAQGLVTRAPDADDARVWRLSLTRRGLALATRTRQVQSDLVAAMIGPIAEADIATVARVMPLLSARLETMRAGAPRARVRAAVARAR